MSFFSRCIVIDKANTAPKFYVKLNGPKVGEAKLSVSDLAEILKRTQQALKRIGQVLYGQESHGKGRKKKEIEKQCELFLAGWEEGSTIAAFELGTQPEQMTVFGFVGEESLRTFLAGIEVMAGNSYDGKGLPIGYDTGVLEAFESLGKVFEHGIDSISFSRDRHSFSEKVVYNPEIRERVRASLGQPTAIGHAAKVGRLEMLNGHGALKGTFWEVNGMRWTCLFKNEHIDMLPDAWMQKVKVTGRIIEVNRCIEVDSLFVIEDDMGEGKEKGQGRSFWQPVSLDELAEEQDFDVESDIDSIAALWPADDDPDDLLEFVLHERGERRRAASERIV
jgi:hypothetical protein